MSAVATFLEAPLAAADGGLTAAIAKAGVEKWIRELLLEYDRRFEAFDMLVLPLAYPDLGERNAVDVVRLSPADAPSIYPDGSKLAGIRFGELRRLPRPEVARQRPTVGAPRRGRGADRRAAAGRRGTGTPEGAGTGGDPARGSSWARATPARWGRSCADALNATGPNADSDLVKAFREAFEPSPPLPNTQRDALIDRAAPIGAGVVADAMDGRGLPRLDRPARRPIRTVGGEGRAHDHKRPGRIKAAPKKVANFVRGLWPFGKG